MSRLKAEIANGLSWVVPDEWKRDLIEDRVSREAHIDMIVNAVRSAMTRWEGLALGLATDNKSVEKLYTYHRPSDLQINLGIGLIASCLCLSAENRFQTSP